jgi:hypothetical protein
MCIALVCGLGTVLAVCLALILAGCAGRAAAPPQASLIDQTGDDDGRWFVDTDPAPPVVGYRGGLLLEYVPTAPSRVMRPEETLPLTVKCDTCAAEPMDVVAKSYAGHGPDDMTHPGATAHFEVGLTFPAAGTWRVEPLGLEFMVRELDPFEPPFIHVRPWSDPLPGDCGRERIAAIARTFEAAYNTGAPDLLASVVQPGMNFSIAGGAAPIIVQDRDAFVAGVSARQAQGERLKITTIHVVAQGSVFLAVAADRTAPDLPGGSQRLFGKGSLYCTQGQFVHLNLGVLSARP